MMVLWLAVALAAWLLLPFVLSIVISALPARRLVGGNALDREFATRVQVVGCFLAGLSDGIRGCHPARSKRGARLDLFERAFWIEGVCAGLQLARRIGLWTASRRLARLVHEHQEYAFLLSIGRGFARGLESAWKPGLSWMRQAPPTEIDPKLDVLFFDGCAFARFITRYRRDPSLLLQGLALEGKAAHGFYEGAGRALWFLLPEPEAFLDLVAGLPKAAAGACLKGYGIAAGFAGCRGVTHGLSRYPQKLHGSEDFHLGLLIGLFARYHINPRYLETVLGSSSFLLHEVRKAATLYRELWERNYGYLEWAEALRVEFKIIELGTARAANAIPS